MTNWYQNSLLYLENSQIRTSGGLQTVKCLRFSFDLSFLYHTYIFCSPFDCIFSQSVKSVIVDRTIVRAERDVERHAYFSKREDRDKSRYTRSSVFTLIVRGDPRFSTLRLSFFARTVVFPSFSVRSRLEIVHGRVSSVAGR